MAGLDRGNATATRTTMPTKRRPIVIEPGEKEPARARIATNDEAHIVTVIIAAPNARDSVDNLIASTRDLLLPAADSSDSRLPLCAKVPPISAESRRAACSGDLFRCIFLDEKWQTIQKG